MSDRIYHNYIEPHYPHVNWVYDNIEYVSLSGKRKEVKPLSPNNKLFDYDEIKQLKIDTVHFNGYKIINALYGVQGTDMIVSFIDPLKKIIFNEKVFATSKEAEFKFDIDLPKTLIIDCIKDGKQIQLIFNEGEEIII